MNMQKYWHY